MSTHSYGRRKTARGTLTAQPVPMRRLLGEGSQEGSPRLIGKEPKHRPSASDDRLGLSHSAKLAALAGWGCYVFSLRLIGEEAGVANRTVPRHGGSCCEAVRESTVGTPEEAGVGTNVEDGLRLRAVCYGEGW